MRDYWGYIHIACDGRIFMHELLSDGTQPRVEVDKLPKNLATLVAALDFLGERERLNGLDSSYWADIPIWDANPHNSSSTPARVYFIYEKDIPERKPENKSVIKRNGYWVIDGLIYFSDNCLTAADRSRIEVLDAHRFGKYIERVGVKWRAAPGEDGVVYDLSGRNYIEPEKFSIILTVGSDGGIKNYENYGDKFEDELENAATVSDLPMLFKNKIAVLDLAERYVSVPGAGKKLGGQFGERNYEIHITKKDQARWAR